MFKAPNPYEDLVVKATNEGLPSENWQLNLDLCDKLSDGDEANAHLMMTAVQSRLGHRNTNVQLYALTLADTLSKNCGSAVHHEIASRAFLQTLTRLAKDRSVHKLVRKRIFVLLREWEKEYRADDTLSLVSDTVRDLKEEYYDLDETDAQDTSNVQAAERLRREEEELQKVLALSVQDQGGRQASAVNSSSVNQINTGSYATNQLASSSATPLSQAQRQAQVHGQIQDQTQLQGQAQGQAQLQGQARSQAQVQAPRSTSAMAEQSNGLPVARPSYVRALYDFEPDEPGELAFFAGDVIRVLDSVYEQWWRGEVRQEVGIFPVNHVEALPEMEQTAIAQDLEMEQSVFAHASDIHRLHMRLQQLDPVRDNFVEDQELQDLYQRSLSLRPKIIRLMDRYSVKVQDLRAMNEKFIQARNTFENLINERIQQYAAQPTPSSEYPNESLAGASTHTSYAPHSPANATQSTSSRSDSYGMDRRTSTFTNPHDPISPNEYLPTNPSSYAGLPDLGPVPQEEEKRRLFEQARAEVDAFQSSNYNEEPTQHVQASSSTADSLARLHLS
ncbi:hypothetical protein MPSI1_002116 [Malassezia psittaci]|uniref:Class E vacuolar protein-sorting machinery protein HSE1 n=1 Tax=Malassezia psittaci TaxID=1821823 RepID=A0AAF0JEI6_9BASI|nr:hypothetical protein MPSI1_002116 [Malassezia psittaci]